MLFRSAAFANAAEFATVAAVNENNASLGQGEMARNRTMHKLVEQFLKSKTPKFIGRGHPKAAPSWVEELEKAFDAPRCIMTEKVTLAAYHLLDSANDWPTATRDRAFPEDTTERAPERRNWPNS